MTADLTSCEFCGSGDFVDVKPYAEQSPESGAAPAFDPTPLDTASPLFRPPPPPIGPVPNDPKGADRVDSARMLIVGAAIASFVVVGVVLALVFLGHDDPATDNVKLKDMSPTLSVDATTPDTPNLHAPEAAGVERQLEQAGFDCGDGLVAGQLDNLSDPTGLSKEVQESRAAFQKLGPPVANLGCEGNGLTVAVSEWHTNDDANTFAGLWNTYVVPLSMCNVIEKSGIDPKEFVDYLAGGVGTKGNLAVSIFDLTQPPSYENVTDTATSLGFTVTRSQCS